MKSQHLLPTTDALPALDPAILDARATDAVREILAEAASANTTRSYASALRYWAVWFAGRYGAALALPVPEAVVVQFVVDHWARRGKAGLTWELPSTLDGALVAGGFKQKPGPFKLATLVHRVAVLSKVHQLRRVANPCESPGVRHLLARARRAATKRGDRQRKKTAITRRELGTLLATCDDTLEGLRDRALLCFAFASGGRRRSEVAVADLADLTAIDQGFVYHLPYSKTRQAGPSAGDTPDKPILGHAAGALRRWLVASGLTEGAIFRRLWKDRIGGPLSPAAVAAIVQRRAALAGLKGDFGGHSLRSGFITEGARQGIALPALMAMTEHRAVSSVMGYFQAGSVATNPAAHLLDADPADP